MINSFENATLSARLVNEKSGDSAVYVFCKQSGDAAIFDLGLIDNLTNREVIKIKHAFVTHAHFDHFTGFDRLIRVQTPNRCKLNMYGPEGFIENVVSKLRGYLWNLLDPGQICITAHEINKQGDIKFAVIGNDNGFNPIYFHHEAVTSQDNIPAKPGARVCALADGSLVDAVVVDHGTPVVSYSLQSPKSFHVIQDKLKLLNLKPGSWISELQSLMVNGKFDEEIAVNQKQYIAGQLADQIFEVSSARLFGYITDLNFSIDNLERLKLIHDEAEYLFCEACFDLDDRDRAKKKYHLTNRQTGLIGKYCRVKQLITFHYSNIYSDRFAELESKAQELFMTANAYDPEELRAAIERELEAISRI